MKEDKVWACHTEKGKLFQTEGPTVEKARCTVQLTWILLWSALYAHVAVFYLAADELLDLHQMKNHVH